MVAKKNNTKAKAPKPGQNVRIEDAAFELLKKHCDRHALRMGVFVSRIIEEKLSAEEVK